MKILFKITLIFILSLSLSCAKKKNVLVLYLSLLPSEEKYYQELIREFGDKTGIHVRLVSQQYLQIKQSIESEIRANRGVVDIFEADVYYLKNLSDYTEDLSGLKQYFDNCNLYNGPYGAGIINDKLLFIPHRISCQALIYNSKFIKTPPKTLEEYLGIAKEFPGKVALKASRYEGLVCDIFPIVWAFGGDELNLKNASTIKALHFISSLKKLIHPGSMSFKENTILEAQAREEIYMHFNWPFSVNYLKEKALFPSPNKSSPFPDGKSVLGGGYLAISKAAPHKEEAKKFLRFIETKTSQGYLLKNLGWLPTRPDAWEYLNEEKKEELSGFIESLKTARPRPVIEDYEKISGTWQRLIHSILFGNISVEDAIQKSE